MHFCHFQHSWIHRWLWWLVCGGGGDVFFFECATFNWKHFDHIAKMRSKETNKEIENEANFNYFRYLLQMYFRFCMAIIIIIIITVDSLDLCKTINNNTNKYKRTCIVSTASVECSRRRRKKWNMARLKNR